MRLYCERCAEHPEKIGCREEPVPCGKTAECSALQELLFRLAGESARQSMERGCCSSSADDLIAEALTVSGTHLNFDDRHLETLCRRLGMSCHRPLPPDRYDLFRLGERFAAPPSRTLREAMIALLCAGLRMTASCLLAAARNGVRDPECSASLRNLLTLLLLPELETEELRKLLEQCGRTILRSMELKEQSICARFGNPSPVRIRLSPFRSKALLVSGDDLSELAKVLEAAKGSLVKIYTHGELLSAHTYPKLRCYEELAGHLRGAWWNQRRDFAVFPGPILMCGSCFLPPPALCRRRFYTSGDAGAPHCRHLSFPSEYRELIAAARTAPGYTAEPVEPEYTFVSGPGRYSAERIDELWKLFRSGALRRIFLVGCCDGSSEQRRFYDRFFRLLPEKSLILTWGCLRFRRPVSANGPEQSMPRILDFGQSFNLSGIIAFLRQLSKAAHLTLAELPLTILLSGHNEKSAGCLLALLAAGFRNICSGPGWPPEFNDAVCEFFRQEGLLRRVDNVEGLPAL